MNGTLDQVKADLASLKYPADEHNEMLDAVEQLGYKDNIGRAPGAPEGAREYLLDQLPGLERLSRHIYGVVYGAGIVDNLGTEFANEFSATLALELLNQGGVVAVEGK